MSRQNKVNIIAFVITAIAIVVFWYTATHDLPSAYYVLPFSVALAALGYWNHRKSKAEKEARAAAATTAD